MSVGPPPCQNPDCEESAIAHTHYTYCEQHTRPMTKRKNIKVKPETFAQIDAEKPEGVTWDYYLLEIRTVD